MEIERYFKIWSINKMKWNLLLNNTEKEGKEKYLRNRTGYELRTVEDGELHYTILF